ncbi:MAG: membrane protein insertion efficiency factor YidD [Pseudomonadota bacterium]
MQKLVLGTIRAYRYLISPFLPPRCRFIPTCSQYALEAVQAHGVRRGLFFGFRRVCRCHPWGDSGYDPVPGTADDTDNKHTPVQTGSTL